jgi:hypothetical protein
VVELLAGIWAVALAWTSGPWYWYGCTTPWGCVHPDVLLPLVPYLGGILVVCAAISLVGFRFAFIPGGTISAILAVAAGYIAVSSRVPIFVLLALFCADAAVLSLWALRRRGALSEQANPMNLPVFG